MLMGDPKRRKWNTSRTGEVRRSIINFHLQEALVFFFKFAFSFERYYMYFLFLFNIVGFFKKI